MPEDRDERAAPPSPKTEAEAEGRVRDERAPDNEQSTPESATNGTEGGGAALSPAARRRRFITRRNAALAAAALGTLVLVAIIGIMVFYRSGQLDRLIANQIIRTLASYNIRAEIGDFRLKFSPRTVEMRNLVLYDATSGERLAHIERLLATVRIEDLYALSLRRNINLESLQIDNLEAWALFNEQGLSNFRNIRLPPPDPNSRILFSYSTATLQLNNAIINYDDEQHQLSGVARNVRATIQPDTAQQNDLEQAAESRMSRVELALSGSTFVYNDRPINDISVDAHARVNQTRADIDELILRSPIAEARLHGTMDDWRALRYQLEVESTVDLTQTSDILQTGTTLRGAGQFVGKVIGEGTRYRVDGRIESDALAADNVRLKGLNISAQANGEGASYEANGRAVAELLTAGDFQLNAVQLAGRVMGTGTDFRWVGELRSAAARSGDVKISNLILSDAAAEVRDGRITASTERVRAGTLSASDATVQGVQAQGVRVASANDRTTISAASVGAGVVTASGARVNDVTARSVVAVNQGAVTNVTAGQVRVGGLNAAGAKVGSLNIAGVRLAIRDGGVTGSSGDVNVGTVTLADGRVEGVRLARPVFTVEPAGRYRASADLSLGGGVLGEIKLGAARSNVVATNNQVQLNNFTADILGGRAEGNATVSTGRGGTSRVAAKFDDLDVANFIAAVSGRVVPIAGKATGTADLQFPGIEVQAASGNLRAKFSGETGDDARGRTPLTGELALAAERGLFRLQQANLRAGASELTATGSFSLERDSDLQINLTSTDSAELQRVLVASGLVPEVEQTLTTYGIELAKNLRFNGTVRGQLSEPRIDGRVSLDSLLVNGRELGTLTASVNSTGTEVRVSEGRLTEPDGGGVQFSLSIPLGNNNNLALNATLERAGAANLLAAVPALNNVRAGLGEISSDLSGRIDVTGSTDALNGSANLRFDQGRIGTIAFNEIVARATFNGSNVVLENLEANLEAGRIAATGQVNINSNDFELQARANNVRLDLIEAHTGNTSGSLPKLSGTADFTANASGNFTDFSTYQVTLDGEGRDVTINGRPAGTLALKGRTEGRQLNIEFTTGLLGQPQVIAARVDLGSRGLTTTVETTLTGTDLTPLFAALLPNANVKVTGRATGALRISGNLISENAEGEESFSLQGLQGSANFTELGVQIEDIQLTATSPLLVNFSRNEVVFEKTQFTGPGTDLTFGGTAALGPGGRQNLTVNGRLNLRVLNNLSPNVFLGGAAEVAVSVGGSYEQPRMNGIASVANASFSTLFGDERLTIANIQGRVRFTANQAQIESLTATLGGGQLAVAGGALLEGLTPTQFRLSVRGDDVTVSLPQNIRATADVNLSVQGSPQTQLIAGTVNLSRAEYTEDIDLADFINRRGAGSLTEGSGGGGGGTTLLDLQVQGRDALVVRNNLADIVGSVSVQIRGSVEEPIIAGRITATRGTLIFRDDRYELTRAFIDLPGRRDPDPLLNIQAEAEIRGYRVIVGLTGPLSQPQAVVRSEPGLPQADVVALITTGNLATDETGGSSLAQAGVGTAATLLADTLINNRAQKATDRLFGLNRFEIDPLIAGRGGASPTARLTVGRQINRNLLVTYSTNVTGDQNQVAALQYRVSDRLSFVAQYEQGSTTGLTTSNNNFNFEIRFRKRF
ncbi:MAG: translocation/assembly module TamB [Pyrinomonadaceae bacterium]|nr:translocation/assembly module TamB [Pyrinomonadaceae bacterium]